MPANKDDPSATQGSPASEEPPAVEADSTSAESPPMKSPAAETESPTPSIAWYRRILGTGGRQASPLRRWSVLALVIVASLGILVSTVALWTHTVLFNTDKYVATVGPIGKDPAVTQAVADAVTAKTMEATDLENRIREVLPPQAQFLVAPLVAQVQKYVNEKVAEFLQTDTAYNAWLTINRNVHEQLVAVLRNQSNRFLVQDDKVRLNLLPLVAHALELVQKYLPDAIQSRVPIPQIDPNAPYDEQVAQLSSALGRTLPPDFGTVVIFQGTQVRQAQQAVRLFDGLVIALWVITGVIILLALLLSPWRLRTLIELGLGTLIAVMIARVLIKRLEQSIIESAKNQQQAGVAKAIITSAISSLGSFTTWLLVACVILAVAAFLGGRPHWIKAAGRGAAGLAGRGADLAEAQLPEAQRMATTYFDYLRGGGVVVALIVLFLVSSSLTWVLVILLLLIAWEIAVWWLARRTTRRVAGGSAHA